MAYNKETHKKESVILPIDIALLTKTDATKQKRSMSGQLSYIIEQYYAQKEKANELENKNS